MGFVFHDSHSPPRSQSVRPESSYPRSAPYLIEARRTKPKPSSRCLVQGMPTITVMPELLLTCYHPCSCSGAYFSDQNT